MERKNMAKRNVLQMSLGSDKNPMNITVGGHDKSVEISINSKNNKNIWTPTSTSTGRRLRQCCLHKNPANEIMLTLPENGRFSIRNVLPLVIESQYLENFKAAFYSPQLFDNDTEFMKETVTCSMTDYLEEIKDKNQYHVLEESETVSKEEQKEYSLKMKNIQSLKRSLRKIGEALKEVEEYQAGILSKGNQRIRNHDHISDKCKIKRPVKHDECTTSRKSDRHLVSSKSAKYMEEVGGLNQIITITPIGKASQGKRKTDALPTSNKVSNLDHATIKKQTKQEDTPRRKNNQIAKHSVREDDFALAEKTMTKLVDNMKSTKLLLKDILQQDKIITATPVTDASQTKIRTVAPSAGNKVPDHAVIEKESKQEAKPRRKENLIDSHSIREGDFATAEKTMGELADIIESSKLMVDDILLQDQIVTGTPVEYASQTTIKTVALPAGNKSLDHEVYNRTTVVQPVDNKVLDHKVIEEEAKQEARPRRKENLIDSHSIREDDFASAEKTMAELKGNMESSKLKLDDILLRDQVITHTPVEDASQTKIKTVVQPVDNKVLDHKVIEEEAKSEAKPRRKENGIHSIRNNGFASANETIIELADNVKSSKLIVNGILYRDQNKIDCSAEEAPQRKTDSQCAGNKMQDHAMIEKQTKQGDKTQRKENQVDTGAVIENIDIDAEEEDADIEFASAGKTVAQFADTVKSSRLMLHDILQREKSMNGYKNKYIQEVEALYEDQQRLLEGICRIYDCSNLPSSEECNLVETSADRQQDPESQTDKGSEFRSDCEETSVERARRYKSNSMPVIANIVKKQNLEEQLGLINVQLEKLIKEIQLLRTCRIIEEEKIKSGLIQKDRQIQETAAETNGAKTATGEGTSTNADLPFKEVTGIISQTYEILKGEQGEGNIYETTLTHTVKKFPSIIDASKYVELPSKEYFEAVSDAQTAMKKLEARFQKLIPILPKISQQSGVDSDASVTVSHHEKNISGKILKEQKFELRNGREKAPKDRPKSHVETKIGREDENLALRRQYIGFERQEDREREQSNSEEFSPRGTSSGKHVSSADPVKKSKGVMSETIESQRLKKSEESSKTGISSKSRTDPKRRDSNKGSMGFGFKDGISGEDFLENECGSIKTINIPEYSQKTEKKIILPSAVRREYFNQYLDDMPQPFQPRHSSMESTRINYDQNSTQQVRVSPSHEDPINFRRYSSIMDKPDEEKMIHLPEKSPATESHPAYKSESDPVFLSKEGLGIQREAEEGSLSDHSLEIPEESEQVIPTEHAKRKSDVMDEEIISSISKYEPSEREVQSYSDKSNKLGSHVIEEGNISSNSQHELEPSRKNHRQKSNEDYKFRGDIIEEGNISNISKNELEPSQEKDRRKSNEDQKFRSNITEGGSISNILPYELEPSQGEVRQKSNDNINKHSKCRSDVIEEGNISSISQYELEEPQELDRRTFGERAIRNSNEYSRSWYVPDEYVGSTLNESDSEEFDKIEEGNRSDISKQKLNNSQNGHNSLNEKSRNWYVPEYFEYSGSVPGSREFNQTEEENRYDISKNKLKKSQRNHTSSNEKSRSWCTPEYVGYSVSEPSSKAFCQIDERRMPDISSYEAEQLRASDFSNGSRRRNMPLYEDQDKFSPTLQYMHRLNTSAGFPLSDTNILRKPNMPLKYQPNTSSESQREKFLEEASLGYNLNEQNARHCSLPYAFNYKKQKTTGTKPRDRAMTCYDVLGNTRKQNVLDETLYRNLPHFNESMNQSDAPLPYPECSRKSCDRTFNRPLSELQYYRNFGGLENVSCQSPSWSNEDMDRDRRQTFDVSCDYNQRNKIRKLYDEIMNNRK